MLLHKVLRERKITLATAESCTGGALAASFVANEGASDYFLGGIIAYSNRAKIELLDVLPQTLEKYSAVSKQVVEEMARNVCKKLHAELGIAVSGNLGPAGDPVGYVLVAVAYQDKIIRSFALQNSGSRKEVLAKTIEQIIKNVTDSF